MHWHVTQTRKDNALRKSLPRKSIQTDIAVYNISILLGVAADVY